MSRRLFVMFFATIVILATTASLAMAGGKSENQPSAASSSSGGQWTDMVHQKYGGTTLTLAFAPHPTTDAFKAMAPDFTAKTGIKLQWAVMDENLLRQKLLLEHQAHSRAYDVLLIDAFNMAQYSPSGVAADLSPFIHDKNLTPSWFDYEDIVPAYRNGIGKFDGTVYGIPVAGETRFVGYRTDLFSKYNKQPPKTMNDLLQLAKFFNRKEPGLYGIAMRGQKGIMFASGWMTVMYNMGGQFLDQKTWKPLLNSPGTVASLKYYVDLLKQAPPDVGTYTHEEAVSAFSLGKTAMWFDSTALVPWIVDPNKSKIVGKVDFVPPPEGPAGAYGALAGWNVGISSDIDQKAKDASWAFIVWMTGKRNAVQYVDNGGTPVRTSIFSDPELIKKNPTYPIILESLKRAANLVDAGIVWIPPNPKALKILELAGTYGNAVLEGQMTAEDAMNKAQAEAVDIMNQ